MSKVDDDFFFDLVRNVVDNDDIVFGSAIGLEPNVYPKYRLTCPYAYKKDGNVNAHDMAIDYVYRYAEYYASLREQYWRNVTLTTDYVSYR